MSDLIASTTIDIATNFICYCNRMFHCCDLFNNFENYINAVKPVNFLSPFRIGILFIAAPFDYSHSHAFPNNENGVAEVTEQFRSAFFPPTRYRETGLAFVHAVAVPVGGLAVGAIVACEFPTRQATRRAYPQAHVYSQN